MQTIVMNGWAASPHAWDLCRFRRDRIVSYLEPDPVLDGPVVLVGWSLGGNRAIRLAAEHPTQVKALVLVSPVVRMMKDEGWPGMGEGRLKAFITAFEMFGGAGLGGHEYPVDPYGNFSHDALMVGIDYLHDSDVRPCLARLSPNLPITVFHSEGDIIARPNNAQVIRDVCPWARVEMVPGAEHTLPLTIPERIDRALTKI